MKRSFSFRIVITMLSVVLLLVLIQAVGISASAADACEHIYNDYTIKSTCTERGYDVHMCKKCGHSYVDNVVLPIGHVY